MNTMNTIGDEARNKNVSPADTNCCLTGMSFAAELKSKKAFEKQGEKNLNLGLRYFGLTGSCRYRWIILLDS